MNNINETQEPLFPFSYRGFLGMIGAWHLAWGFFIRQFSGAFSAWITRDREFTADFLPEVGLILMLSGSILFLVAAFPMRYRVLLVFCVLSFLTIGAFLYTGAFAGQATKQLYFHLISNYVLTSIFLIIIGVKAQQVAKSMKMR